MEEPPEEHIKVLAEKLAADGWGLTNDVVLVDYHATAEVQAVQPHEFHSSVGST